MNKFLTDNYVFPIFFTKDDGGGNGKGMTEEPPLEPGPDEDLGIADKPTTAGMDAFDDDVQEVGPGAASEGISAVPQEEEHGPAAKRAVSVAKVLAYGCAGLLLLTFVSLLLSEPGVFGRWAMTWGDNYVAATGEETNAVILAKETATRMDHVEENLLFKQIKNKSLSGIAHNSPSVNEALVIYHDSYDLGAGTTVLIDKIEGYATSRGYDAVIFGGDTFRHLNSRVVWASNMGSNATDIEWLLHTMTTKWGREKVLLLTGNPEYITFSNPVTANVKGEMTISKKKIARMGLWNTEKDKITFSGNNVEGVLTMVEDGKWDSAEFELEFYGDDYSVSSSEDFFPWLKNKFNSMWE